MSSSVPIVATTDHDEPRVVDSAKRGLSMLLVLSALLWLIAGGSLFLVHSIQTHTPGFFGYIEWFTFGRMHAAAQTALLYGWAANAAFAVAFGILDRLGSASSRAGLVSVIAAVAWNIAVTVAVAAIVSGDFTGHSVVQVPGYITPVLVVSSLLLSSTGLFTWADRQKANTFVSHGYAALSLFVLPWLLAVLAIAFQFFPARGVLTSVIAAWDAQNLLYLWLAPVALSASYYLVPKITGERIPGYNMAIVGFWILVAFAPWTGTRILAGGPFPVWISSVGIAAGFILLAHHAIVFANLSDALFSTKQSYVLGFIGVSVASYLILGLAGTAGSLRTLSQYLQFTYWTEAVFAVFLFGFLSSALFASIYYLMPRLTGRPWASDGLIIMHYRAAISGLLLIVIGLGGAGLIQGSMQSAQELSASTLSTQMKPLLLIASAGFTLQLLGAVFLAVNFAFQLLPQSGLKSSPGQSSTVSAS